MEKNLKVKIIIGVVVVILFGGVLIFYNLEKSEEKDLVFLEETTILETKKVSVETIFVDIKGAVKKPGVYELNSNSLVKDVIKEAGGLKKNAYTNNINLAQKLKDEMVIYIFSTSEIKKNKKEEIITNTECVCEVIEVNNCIETTTSTNIKENTSSSTLVNINTASLEELMKVSGIGESKAKSIIEYRESKKFATIEDIKNVSGIGESLFAKIKDYITV